MDIEKEVQVNNDEISLMDLIKNVKNFVHHLWKKKWVIIFVALLGSLLGLAYSFYKKPIYTASTTFVLEGGEKTGGIGAYSGVASMMGIDLGGNGGGIFQGDNIIELYKSRLMLEKTLYSSASNGSSEPLIEEYIRVNELRKGWENKPLLKKISFKIKDVKNTSDPKLVRVRDSVIGLVIRDLSKNSLSVARPDKKLSIIRVDIKSIDEDFAKRFNEELVKNVNDFYVQTKTKKSFDNVVILQRKTDSVRSVMNGAIYAAAAVADATPNLNPTRQVQRAAPVQRSQFSAETNKLILAEMMKNLEMSKIALMKETPLIQVVDKPIYPLSKDKLGKLEGMFFGGVIFGFLIVLYYTIRLVFKRITGE